jgi:hypothetical protein
MTEARLFETKGFHYEHEIYSATSRNSVTKMLRILVLAPGSR